MSGKSSVNGLSFLDQQAAFRYIAVMIRDLSDLPSDPDQLKAKLFELASAAEEAAAQRDAALLENEKLLFILAEFKRALYGRRSEKLDPDQLQLIFDMAGAAAATTGEAGSAQEERTAAAASKKPRKPATRNRGMLPQHLPRIEIRIDVEDKTCPCGGERHLIGETVTEMLDVVPAQYRVKRIVRLRYGCRICEEGVVQAPAPARPVEGGIPTEALLAAIAVAKFAWHLPLNRQLRMMRGQGIELDRSTLSLWIGKTAWWLQPLYALLLASILARPKIFCDETPLPVFARGGTRRCQFWAVAVDDRPWCGPAPPAVAYAFATGRKTEHAMTLLESFSGVLQVDGYAAYKKLAATEREGKLIVLAFCLAHARRKFFEFHKATNSPIAFEALRQIATIYAIEKRIRGQSAAERLAVRQAESRPLMEAFKSWAENRLAEVSAKSPLAGAIRYTLNHWDGLTVFLTDGRVEVDNNTVERDMRPIGLGRRNSLFAGSENGAVSWSILASLINTALLNDVDPQAWLTDVLERIVSGRTKSHQLAELLPWNWKAARDAGADDQAIAA
jgi:transposase